MSPRLADLASRISRGSITVMTVIVASLFGLYFFVFYPCPWYKIDELRAKEDHYAVTGQWSYVEDIGQELCDCGALSEGWDWQARSEYFSAQYRIAINFWRRAIKAQPAKAEPLTANIADAYIWLDDFKTAVDLYKKIYEANPLQMHLRYGYGRALTFYGRYQDAIDILAGVPSSYNDGGSQGQARIFEAAARFNHAASLDNDEREQELKDARQNLCVGLAEPNYDWKRLLDSRSDDGHFSRIRTIILRFYKSDC